MNSFHPQSRLTRGVLMGALAILSIGFLPACSAADGAPSGEAGGGSDAVVAKIGGTTLTMADLETQAAPQLKQLDAQRFQILEQNLQGLIEKTLFEMEAKERGVSVDELINAEVESRLGEVTDAQVSAWYEENKERVRQPLENVAPQIRNLLQQQGKQDARGNFIESLRAKHDVAIMMEPRRVEVEVAGAPTKGPADAPVTIIEWSDFECPYCSRVVPSIDKVVETYGDKVRIAFRQFPLGFHANAQKAAEASLCANEQGKFWDYHDALFANQKELAVAKLKEKAGAMGLDAGQFDSCLDSGKYADQVADDMAAGQAAGVSGTPSIFVNGRPLPGAVPYEQIAELIDDELRRKGLTD